MEFLFDHFFELTITGLALGSVYALVALGYTMVYGVLQLINFAHSEVFMYGTFAVIWTLYFLGGTASSSTGSVIGMLLVALVVAMAVSGGIALLLERFAYRPLLKRGAPKLVALISAIGASFVLAELMGLRDKIAKFIGLEDELTRYVGRPRDTAGMPVEITPQQVFTIGDYAVTNIDVLVIVSALLMMMMLDQYVRRSRIGRGIRAVAQDPESAALMGVNSTRVVQLTFLLGGLMAGAAATLYMVRIGADPLRRRLHSRRQGLHRCGAGRHRQPARCAPRRAGARGRRELGVGDPRHAVEGRRGLRPSRLILLFRPTGLLGESLGKARA